MATDLAILMAIVALYAVVATWLERRSITMPMFFLAAGAIFGVHGLGWISLPLSSEVIKIITEITLALLLFADSSTLRIGQLRQDAGLPARLLFIALPLVIGLGGGLAYALVPGEGLGFALLIGAVLAPTDAALGLPIFNNRRVPVRIRRALNVESGLNDGIATPFVTLFVALAVAEESQNLTGWLSGALTEIGIAVVVGAAMGALGGWLFARAMGRRLTTRAVEQIGTLALALGVYLGSVALGGNGFIAAFVGGLFFSYATRHHQHHAVELAESTGTLLSLLVWTIFGANLAIPLLTTFQPEAFLYAVLSLTIIRMVPVAISLVKTGFRADTKLLMGWLGPRGLASVVFTLIAYESFYEVGRPYDLLFAMAGWTILLSVVLHGFSALPLARWYAGRLKPAPADIPEMMDVPEVKTSRHQLSGIGRANSE